jgi:hypothetical protein
MTPVAYDLCHVWVERLWKITLDIGTWLWYNELSIKGERRWMKRW